MTYNILSPDNVPIRGEDFNTKMEMFDYFEQWIERYRQQGYYSSNNGRISFDLIKSYCKVECYHVELKEK